ncbi:MAG TPA: hypothetical protein VFJ64_12240 [Solirubrobacterales bacterium]|nr:hypothetical protein [Solirubrobacterales bacterium]
MTESIACPLTDFIDQLNGRLAIEWLGIEQFVVAHRHGVDGQLIELFGIHGQLGPVVLQELEKAADVVDSDFVHAPVCHQRLQPLLDCLLGVEADDLVGYFRVAGEFADGDRIGRRLPDQDGRLVGGLRR